MAKISLSNIAEELAVRNGLSRDVTDNFIRAFVETIEKGLQEDNVVKIKGLGTFKLQEMSDRGSVDVNTGERITIKGYRKVTFTPDSAMKEFVNRPFAHFEPTELNDGYPDENESVMSESLVDESEEGDVVEEIAEVVVTEPSEPIAEVIEELVVKEGISEDIVGEITEPSESSESAEFAESTESAESIVEVVTEEVVEDVVESTAVNIEKKTEEIVEETIEEDKEAVKSEEAIVEMMEAVTGPIEELTETAEQPVSVIEKDSQQKPEEPKKHRGCGWLIVLLLVLAAVGVYYWYTSNLLPDGHLYRDDAEVYDNMMVNPNLEEELGAEWGDEPELETKMPTGKKEVSSLSETSSETTVSEEEDGTERLKKSVTSEKTSPLSTETTQPVAEIKFCAITITESLQAKTLKDITPADTLDYMMDGTLVSHELKNGETIIQLAKKYYGDKRLWPYIVRYNWMKDFNNVAIGQMINIPMLKEKNVE